jgi:hypothetical protein
VRWREPPAANRHPIGTLAAVQGGALARTGGGCLVIPAHVQLRANPQFRRRFTPRNYVTMLLLPRQRPVVDHVRPSDTHVSLAIDFSALPGTDDCKGRAEILRFSAGIFEGAPICMASRCV